MKKVVIYIGLLTMLTSCGNRVIKKYEITYLDETKEILEIKTKPQDVLILNENKLENYCGCDKRINVKEAKLLEVKPIKTNKMENFIKKIEEKFENEINNFDDKPIRTSLKWLLIYFIIRKIYNYVTKK